MARYFRTLSGAFGVLVLFLGTCDKPNPVDTDNPDATPSFGTFLVTLVAPQGTSAGYATVFGKVNKGPTPSGIIWKEKVKDGNCRLLTPEVPSCDEPCGGNALCVEGDTCQSYPDPVYAGIVTVKGIRTTDGGTQFTMDTLRWNYQRSSNIAFPPFNEGDNVSVTTASLNLTAKGITPLEVPDDSIVLESGKAVTLRWTPPAVSGNTVITVTVDISHHGGTAGIIECECPDNGSLTIPASLIDALKALGYFGFPKIEMTRKSVARDSVTHVELVIESKVTKYVYIPGLISCNGDEDCPDGQTCENFRCK